MFLYLLHLFVVMQLYPKALKLKSLGGDVLAWWCDVGLVFFSTLGLTNHVNVTKLDILDTFAVLITKLGFVVSSKLAHTHYCVK